MVLIFIKKLSSRKQYIFKHIFKRLLEIPFEFTSDISEFIAYEGPKLSYGKKPLGDEFFIWSHGLLNEVGIDDHDVEVHHWDDLPIFFKAPDRSNLPFDIFSASFYLLTRYEEYLPQVKDELGRFTASASIAAQNNFLDTPLVDFWVKRLGLELEKRFGITLPRKRNIQIITAIETASVFQYKNRAVVPVLQSIYENLIKFKLRKLFRQLGVHLRLIKDPYDVYDIILRIYKESLAKLPKTIKNSRRVLYLFHLGDYNYIDNGVSYRSRSYQELIKHIADYVEIGLRFSFANGEEKIEKETERYESITNRPLSKTMTAFSKISMPGHYKRLVDMDTIEDYSMGYTNVPGYRASTSNSFYFYDLDYEVQTPLRVLPYALHYRSIEHFMLNGQQAIIDNLLKKATIASGNFIVVFDNAQLDLKKRSHIYTIIKKLLTYNV
ncbi:hypothetical protein FNJ87_11895 [Nonlabens mediterrranea]|uniref:DUF7033 domain-containing protein n=1 Tax=Nonlabens mediterrranea TaxID=1419947 RepID=A0ABS0A6P5_9FLAO|nr:hypothetical protein [Nonlabens mediterrranea]